MNRRVKLFFVLSALAGISVLGMHAARPPQEERQTRVTPPFHDASSPEPLPAILDASFFRKNPPAFVAYSLAERIPQTLYQVPCYCGCDKEDGHQSLHDCFTSKHGVRCHTCQKEAVFCFVQNQKGKSPAQIRKAIARDKISKFNFDKYVERFLREIEGPSP